MLILLAQKWCTFEFFLSGFYQWLLLCQNDLNCISTKWWMQIYRAPAWVNDVGSSCRTRCAGFIISKQACERSCCWLFWTDVTHYSRENKMSWSDEMNLPFEQSEATSSFMLHGRILLSMTTSNVRVWQMFLKSTLVYKECLGTFNIGVKQLLFWLSATLVKSRWPLW